MTSYRGGTLEGLGAPVQVDPYNIGGIDPGLEDCCRRELEGNRRQNALTSTLRRHDVVAMAERRHRNIIKTEEGEEGCRCCFDPNADGGEYRALMEYKQEHPIFVEDHPVENTEPNLAFLQSSSNEKTAGDDDSENDSDNDEFDYLLDEVDDLPGNQELEEARRAELEFQMLSRQVALQHGYGRHRQLHPTRVLKAAGFSTMANSSRQPPPAVVLHLVDPDSISSASLDYYFETKLSSKYPGTIFLRSGGRSTLLMDASLAQHALPRLNPETSMPALIAIKEGVAVNVCPNLQGLTIGRTRPDEPIEPSAVEQWLDQSGVLQTQPPPFMELCQVRPEEDALMDYLAHQTPQVVEEERYDCGLESCNKSFPHEHVGIKTSEQSGLVVKEETVLGVGEDA